MRNKSRDILPEFTEGDSGDAGRSANFFNTDIGFCSHWIFAKGGVEVVMGNFQVQPLPHCLRAAAS